MIYITYFVHGTTTDNEQGISSGWYNVSLSELGIVQSLDLKNTIRTKHFDIVFCSDFKRAIDSANLTFWDRGIEILADNRLRECNYGIYNAQASEIVEPLQETKIQEKFEEWESYEEVKTRISDFLDFLKENYKDKSIAIVWHKAPQLALEVLLNGKTWKQAFGEDWRKKWTWKPGWEYIVK